MANFNSNPKKTIIIIYSQVEGSKDAEEHFENLTNVVNSIPKHKMVIECGYLMLIQVSWHHYVHIMKKQI